MPPSAIDNVPREIALRKWVLPECLHAPVAAVDEDAIRTYVGDIERVLSRRLVSRAFLVRVAKPVKIDPDLPICRHPNAGIIHARTQVWVHVAYTRYRAAYRSAFPDEPLGLKILSHCVNRRLAALQGFEYVRIVPISRAANSSSSFSEQWGVELRRTQQPPIRPPYIQHADLAGLMLMLDMNLGGGVMQAVNEGQMLVQGQSALSRNGDK
jgi:hypothetical protein